MQRKQTIIAFILLGVFLVAHSHDWVPHHHHSHGVQHDHSDHSQDGHDHDHTGLISMLSGLLHQHTHVPHDRQAEMNAETTICKAPSKKQFQLIPGIAPSFSGLAVFSGTTEVICAPQVLAARNFHADNSIGRAPPFQA